MKTFIKQKLGNILIIFAGMIALLILTIDRERRVEEFRAQISSDFYTAHMKRLESDDFLRLFNPDAPQEILGAVPSHSSLFWEFKPLEIEYYLTQEQINYIYYIESDSVTALRLKQ